MRRKSSPNDSLEMFLDTICNTFGGILFILLFVVLQLRTTQDTVSQNTAKSVDAVQFHQAENRLLDAERRAYALKTQWDYCQKYAETFTDEETRELYKKLLSLTEASNRLSEDNLKLAAQLAVYDNKTAQCAESIENLKQQVELLRTEQINLERQNKALRDKNKQNVTLPQLHASYKGEVGLILRFGRIYLWHRYSSDGVRQGPNIEDFTILEEESEYMSSIPNPWCGIDLESRNTEEELDQLLSTFNPTDHKMVLVVSPDTFAQYHIVCDFLKTRSFDTRPIMFGPDDSIADRGGRNTEAQ